MSSNLLSISAIVATRNRSIPLNKMLNSLAQQSAQPVEMIVVDASTNGDTKLLCQTSIPGLSTQIIYQQATEIGAATQRNQGINSTSQDVIWLLDDDIVFEKGCVEKLWKALESDPMLGGVNAMIINQQYLPPSKASQLLFRFLNDKPEISYAGKCIGPAFNLLPEDRPDLPEVVSVEWLNTTCTLYRREALPQPLFPPIFTGYSLLEDVALSLMVGKKWKLANARTAKIFHDSQPGDHKSDMAKLAKMELVNRYYVMTRIMGRTGILDYSKLAILEGFRLITSFAAVPSWKYIPAKVLGKIDGIKEILSLQYSDASKEIQR